MVVARMRPLVTETVSEGGCVLKAEPTAVASGSDVRGKAEESG